MNEKKETRGTDPDLKGHSSVAAGTDPEANMGTDPVHEGHSSVVTGTDPEAKIGTDPASGTAVPRLDYIREQIKDRPLNKRKLLRRTMVTAGMAVLFGLVACFTLVFIEPLLTRRLHKTEEPEMVRIPIQTVEVLPADLPLTDTELPAEQEKKKEEEVPAETDRIQDYYKSLQSVTDSIATGLVTITTVTSGDNWLEGNVENRNQSTGAIVADTTRFLLILARNKDMQAAENITVTFHNGTIAEARIRMSDPVTGISVLEASKEGLDEAALQTVTLAELGNSNSSSLKGGTVIALGSPMGINDSVSYGMITSTGTPVQTVDSRYRLIMTDIYGSQHAQGFLANLQGQIIGVINQDYNDADIKNMISGIGISELQRTVERLSNSRHQPYLGLVTEDISTQIHEERGVPFGAYITKVEMDSPALPMGVQGGDVVVAMDDTILTSQAEYIDTLSTYSPGDELVLTIKRESRGEYQELKIPITLGDLG